MKSDTLNDKHPIGILGGTFDPIHFGHLRMGLEICEALDLQEVRFIPCKQPVHKEKTYATTEQRVAMLRIALAEEDKLVVDCREVMRDTPSYMVETLQSLRDEVGDQPLCLIIGMDALSKLNTWCQWETLFELAHIIVVPRPNSNFEIPKEIETIIQQRSISTPKKLYEKPAGTIYKQSTTDLNISASAIRKQIATDQSPRYLLPQKILEYIQIHGIYRSKSCD